MANMSPAQNEARRSLQRLLPRLEERFSAYAAKDSRGWEVFVSRVDTHFDFLFEGLLHLYKDHYDFFYYLEELLMVMARYWAERPAELKELDAQREANPFWYQSNEIVGGVCYVDLLAGDLCGIREKIPYFKELGLSYLHLMPLFLSPNGESDGGYAVSSYRDVNPALGTMEQLTELASELRREGISLALDFVFNHTSNEHEWALKTKAGDAEFLQRYHIFLDRQLPDAYDSHLREIFPEERSGAFTYVPEMDKWVWTTFNSFQWDLNYANPAVFNRMAEEMLFLANVGVDVLRLDAVAFIWKQLGTSSENLPGAHVLIQAFNAVTRIAAPGLLFKSEAIVHPDEVAKYISLDECQLSYNPLLMATLWEALATRDVRLLTRSMQTRLKIPEGCSWVNYVRSHDDIGWTFSDEDANQLGINAFHHRQFLNSFYTGLFEGSFARGLPFQYNPRTQDARVSGTCASLAGLEGAIKNQDDAEVDFSIKRIILLHSIVLSIGGLPLIYLGDEIATLNDYSYRSNPVKSDDSRWVHRPPTDWERAARRSDPATIEGRVFSAIQHLIEMRKRTAAFSCGETHVIDSHNPQVFGYVREHLGERALVFANFTEQQQNVTANVLRVYGLSYDFADLLNEGRVAFETDLTLAPYQFVWLKAIPDKGDSRNPLD